MNREEKRKKFEEINVLNEVISIMRSYFPELINKFNNLTDLRHQSYITYQMKVIFMVRLLGLMCEIKSMHEMTSELNTEKAIENIAKICGLKLEEIPHCDTINNVFEQVEVTEIDYRDYKINIIRYKEIKKDKEIEFMYMTDLPITNKNIEMSIVVGRKRWKIENEGFNIQKNGTFNIGHLYSKNATAIKVHYLMIQIAHILRQMLEKGQIRLKEDSKEGKIKIKEISSKIKMLLISTQINLVGEQRSQLRFD